MLGTAYAMYGGCGMPLIPSCISISNNVLATSLFLGETNDE